MPGIVQRGRKRPSAAASEDEEEDYGHRSSVSAGSKRARHTPGASHANGRQRNRTQTQDSRAGSLDAQDEGGFQPGSLIRIKLKNFVTYTAAEFHLGPSLNMVIGPNGTGKSTLVCAICLGLGWSSEHLGRAKELGQFVKHGAAEAEIEIELAAGPGQGKNPIVQRTIRKEDNKSYFLLDGKRVTQSAITTMAKGYSIQIDNLCQFLPQDRVVEFAKMTDVDRLRETQRAAAPPYMVEWHDQLKGLRSEEKELETKQQNERMHLERLEKQQNSSRADVERFHQREGLLQKAKCLKKVKPIIEIRLRKNDITQAKENIRAAKRELDQINADVAPVRQAQAEMEVYRSQTEQAVKYRKDRFETTKKEANQLLTRLESDKQSISDSMNEIEGELSSKKDRERDIKRVTADIGRLQSQRNDQPPELELNAFNQRRADIRAQASAVSSRLVDAESEYAALRSKAHDFNVQNKALGESREQLNTQDGKQQSLLMRTSRDTAAAWAWLGKNRDKLPLRGEVHGPPILTCSIPNSRYASAVESQMRKGEMVAITCTDNTDGQLLSNKFLGKPEEGGLGLHDVYIRTSLKPYSSYEAPVAAADLGRFGLDSYIIDHIRGPDAILAMLCDNARLNRIGFASQAITEQQFQLLKNSTIQTCVSGNETFKITKRYDQSSTAVAKLRPAQYFVDQPANAEERQGLDEKLRQLRQDAAELKEQINTVKAEINGFRAQQDELRQQKEDIQTEQNRIQKAIAEWEALPNKISQKQTQLESYIEQNAETKNRIQAIKARTRDTALRVATMTLAYAKAVTQMRVYYEAVVEAEIRLIEAKSEYTALKNENRDILQRQQRKLVEIADLEQRNRELRKEYERMRETTQQDIETLTAEEKEIVVQYRDLPSLDALEQEIDAVNSGLELMVEGNAGVIKAFEKREEEIQKTREKLEEHSGALGETKQKVANIRLQWEPELDALIARISDAFAYNFQKIGCAGEVRVYKDEKDFNNWSIQISVRFRESEALSVLNSHRQSGGERAVSTIFYLMALQDLAQSPFRVVDEINQGMDPRNERMVHERMVDIACQERTSQYFLVTPKLLSGLKFHPKMKVHVINSGEHIPDISTVQGGWDLTSMAKIALRSRKGIRV